MSMRIGMISMHTSPLDPPGKGDAGGMNVYIMEAARHLAQLGCQVDLLTLTQRPEDRVVSVSPGVRLLELYAGCAQELKSLSSATEARVKSARSLELLRCTPRFAERIMEQGRYDILHSHYWLSGTAAEIVSTEQNIPQVINLHTLATVKNALLAEGDTPEPQERLVAERRLVNTVSRVIASTLTEARAIANDYQANFEKIAVISPGVDTQRFYPADREAERESGELDLPADGAAATTLTDLAAVTSDPNGFMLVLARVQPLKGQDLAIRTLAELRRRQPTACPKLVIAGAELEKYRDYAQSLRQITRELNLEKLVYFVDAVEREQVPALMRAARLLLVPSYSETFGLVTLEAAASGTPVIASLTDGLIDAVIPHMTGLLVNGRDPQVWASTIAELLESPNRYRHLSEAAVQRAARLDWNNTATSLLNLYQQLT